MVSMEFFYPFVLILFKFYAVYYFLKQQNQIESNLS